VVEMLDKKISRSGYQDISGQDIGRSADQIKDPNLIF
jgi:hypothetical protein